MIFTKIFRETILRIYKDEHRTGKNKGKNTTHFNLVASASIPANKTDHHTSQNWEAFGCNYNMNTKYGSITEALEILMEKNKSTQLASYLNSVTN